MYAPCARSAGDRPSGGDGSLRDNGGRYHGSRLLLSPGQLSARCQHVMLWRRGLEPASWGSPRWGEGSPRRLGKHRCCHSTVHFSRCACPSGPARFRAADRLLWLWGLEPASWGSPRWGEGSPRRLGKHRCCHSTVHFSRCACPSGPARFRAADRLLWLWGLEPASWGSPRWGEGSPRRLGKHRCCHSTVHFSRCACPSGPARFRAADRLLWLWGLEPASWGSPRWGEGSPRRLGKHRCCHSTVHFSRCACPSGPARFRAADRFQRLKGWSVGC